MKDDCPGQNIDCIRWMASRDGRDDAWWAQQRKWNADIEAQLLGHGRRIGSLERKVVFASGFAAAVGAIIGAVAGYLLTGVIGN